MLNGLDPDQDQQYDPQMTKVTTSGERVSVGPDLDQNCSRP